MKNIKGVLIVASLRRRDRSGWHCAHLPVLRSALYQRSPYFSISYIHRELARSKR